MAVRRIGRRRLGVIGALAIVAALTVVSPSPVGGVTVPGTNGLIAAHTDVGLVAIDPDTGTSTPVFEPGAGVTVLDPQVNPAGDRVVAWAFEDGVPGAQVVIMDFPSGANRSDVAAGTFPSFSADGSQIVFSSCEAEGHTGHTGGVDHSHICVIPSDLSGSPVPLDGTEDGDTAPVFSPDGSYIFFESGDGIYRVDSGGGNRTKINGTEAGDRSPAVSPDATGDPAAGRVYFSNDFGIFHVPYPDGGTRTELTGTGTTTDGTGNESRPFPSPDGSYVGFDVPPGSLLRVNADGTGGRTPISGGGDAESGHWSRSEPGPDPTATATAGPTPTATAGPTPTATAGPTPTATAGPTPTATAAPTPTASATPAPPTPPAEICDDDKDNDGDGFADETDSDCSFVVFGTTNRTRAAFVTFICSLGSASEFAKGANLDCYAQQLPGVVVTARRDGEQISTTADPGWMLTLPGGAPWTLTASYTTPMSRFTQPSTVQCQWFVRLTEGGEQAEPDLRGTQAHVSQQEGPVEINWICDLLGVYAALAPSSLDLRGFEEADLDAGLLGGGVPFDPVAPVLDVLFAKTGAGEAGQ